MGLDFGYIVKLFVPFLGLLDRVLLENNQSTGIVSEGNVVPGLVEGHGSDDVLGIDLVGLLFLAKDLGELPFGLCLLHII